MLILANMPHARLASQMALKSRGPIPMYYEFLHGICTLNLSTLNIKIAQKPYITGSLGPKAVEYESFEGKGQGSFRL